MGEVEVVGYTRPVVAHMGETVECMVSTSRPTYKAGLIRLSRGGEPIVADGFAQPVELNGRAQPYRRGSYMRADLSRWSGWSGEAAVQCWFYPTLLGRPQCLFSLVSPGGAIDLDLVGERAVLRQVAPGGLITDLVSTALSIDSDSWYFITARFNARAGSSGIVMRRSVPPGHPPRETETVSADCGGWKFPSPKQVLVAASGADGGVAQHFNGKIDSPRLFARSLSDADIAALSASADPRELDSLVASWSFEPSTSSLSGLVRDIGPVRADAELINLPTLGVTGRNWTGRSVSFVEAPEEYRAAHFHDDDLIDCGWSADLAFTVPTDLASGVYAVKLETDCSTDVVPFIVSRGKATGARAPLAVLLPTFSYLAYANEHASWCNPLAAGPDFDRLMAAVNETDRYIAENRLNGTYDRHTDGTGTSVSSWLRPVLNFRADYQMPIIEGPHQLSEDLELLAWLDAEKIDYEVITDDDLHSFGLSSLAGFRAVITGSHPEYWSPDMLQGLDDYLQTGGRLAYLGGNGFYWVTVCPPGRTDIIEVRRGFVGTRSWESAPGEEYHAFTGERGGLWRLRGWAPQRLTGVGMTAQGFDRSLPYKWCITADDDIAGFIAAGIDTSHPLGDAGSVLGGAAGFEVDRLDARLGTPRQAVLVARASGFSDGYQGVIEDVRISDSLQGGTVSSLVRSDVVFFRTPSGGAVFSVGSIAWCGALGVKGGDNDVARVTRNVLVRFADPSPFVVPDAVPERPQ
jgi:N,N-dimethylformamidase